ncbi:MAG: VOC family protein [Eubacteriales bacterium]
MKITGIHHVAIKVKPEHFPKVVGFYKDLLCLTKVRSWGSGGSKAVMLSTGDNSTLEIMSGNAENTPSEGALRHIALECDDAAGFGRLAEENGYEVVIPAKEITLPSSPPYEVTICFIKGPAGEIIEFFEVR